MKKTVIVIIVVIIGLIFSVVTYEKQAKTNNLKEQNTLSSTQQSNNQDSSDLKISDTSVNTSVLNGQITNSSTKRIKSRINVNFYLNDSVVKTYEMIIDNPPNAVTPFGLAIDKFKYDRYEFKSEVITQ